METDQLRSPLVDAQENRNDNDSILNPEQIEYADKLVEANHPLSKLEIAKVWPFLMPFKKIYYKCRGREL
jgi:hypothetical protein